MTSLLPQGVLSILLWLLATVQLLSQPVITGLEVFTTDSSGAQVDGFVWNTIAGDAVPNAWVDSPEGYLNGPTDSLTPVMIVPEFGSYYFVVRNDFTFNPNYIGVSVWFNSASTPQISVFGSPSGFGHSSRPGFSDTFTDGIWTVKLGSQNLGSLAWAAPGAPILDARIDAVGPFAVGSNGILDGSLVVSFDVVPEPSMLLLSAHGTLVLLGFRWVRSCGCRNPCLPNEGAAPNAGGRRLLTIPTPLAARVGKLGRSAH